MDSATFKIVDLCCVTFATSSLNFDRSGIRKNFDRSGLRKMGIAIIYFLDLNWFGEGQFLSSILQNVVPPSK